MLGRAALAERVHEEGFQSVLFLCLALQCSRLWLLWSEIGRGLCVFASAHLFAIWLKGALFHLVLHLLAELLLLLGVAVIDPLLGPVYHCQVFEALCFLFLAAGLPLSSNPPANRLLG